MKITPLPFLIAAMVLCGCVAPSKEKWATADCGLPPLNPTTLVREWMKDNLIDPYSVQDLEVSEPVRGAIQKPLIQGGGYVFGWRAWVKFNAKNRMGGYTGRTTHVFFFRDENIVAAAKAGNQRLPDMWY